MATLMVWSDTADGAKYGVDSNGRVTATRNFLIRITAGGQALTEPQRISLILNDSRIPRYNDLLFVTSALPAQYATTPPRVVTVDITLLGEEPNTYKATVEYGYSDNNTSSGEGIIDEDIPDETRERFPWEQDAEVSTSYGNATEVIPEYAKYMGNKSIAEVVSERGTSAAIQGTATDKLIMNTADDLFESPPTKKLHSAIVTISFNRLKENSWPTVATLNTVLFKVNREEMILRVGGVALPAMPAGTVMFNGWEASPSTHTYSKPWRKGKRHPFVPSEGYNNTKADITVYKYYTYIRYSLSFEFQPYGYLKYIANIGFRDKYDSPYENYSIPLSPILGPDGNAVTAPMRLDATGTAIAVDAPISDTRFQKYKYYDDVPFTPIVSTIPWVYAP